MPGSSAVISQSKRSFDKPVRCPGSRVLDPVGIETGQKSAVEPIQRSVHQSYLLDARCLRGSGESLFKIGKVRDYRIRVQADLCAVRKQNGLRREIVAAEQPAKGPKSAA